MATSTNMQAAENCCDPGDVTLTQIPHGFLIGRATAKDGAGPWWEYIAIVRTESDALHQASTLARFEGVRAWRHVRGDEYVQLA